MSNHLIDIVDGNDTIIGTATKDEAQQKGLAHRVVRISLEDPAGNILIQKRQNDKELYPGCWDSSAAGHVDSGEVYEEAAERELYEELGVVTSLEEVKHYPSEGKFDWRILKRFNKLYTGVIAPETSFTLQEDEVSDVRWVTRAELQDLLLHHPDQVADGLKEVYEILYKS